jgi:hypothetical protein
MESFYSLLGLILCVALWFFNRKILANKLIEPYRKYPYTKFEKCAPPLGTVNGIGFNLICGGRYEHQTESEAYYLFFSLLIPLIPIGCYRAKEVNSSHRGNSYRIYGHEKWRFWEVFSIYISGISWCVGFICLISLIFSFF